MDTKAFVGQQAQNIVGAGLAKIYSPESDDVRIRSRALELANIHAHGETLEKTVERAQAYADFISSERSSGDGSPAPEASRSCPSEPTQDSSAQTQAA